MDTLPLLGFDFRFLEKEGCKGRSEPKGKGINSNQSLREQGDLLLKTQRQQNELKEPGEGGARL